MCQIVDQFGYLLVWKRGCLKGFKQLCSEMVLDSPIPDVEV